VDSYRRGFEINNMICAHPPSRKILDPVARPLYCRMADWKSFMSEAIASSVRDQLYVQL